VKKGEKRTLRKTAADPCGGKLKASLVPLKNHLEGRSLEGKNTPRVTAKPSGGHGSSKKVWIDSGGKRKERAPTEGVGDLQVLVNPRGYGRRRGKEETQSRLTEFQLQ